VPDGALPPAGRIAAGDSSTSAMTCSGACAASHNAVLPPNEVPIRLKRSSPIALAASRHRPRQLGLALRARVLGRGAKARHLEGDHPIAPGQQLVRRVEPQPAGAVQMHQRRPSPASL